LIKELSFADIDAIDFTLWKVPNENTILMDEDNKNNKERLNLLRLAQSLRMI